MAKAAPTGLNPDLEKTMSALLKEAQKTTTPLEDRLLIVDRVLKYEAMKQKAKDAGQGAAWNEDQTGDE